VVNIETSGVGSDGDDPTHLGEFGLIARLTQGLEPRPDVLLGVGDDAALLDIGAGDLLVATCDAQVDGIHFIRGVATYEEIGHKALAVNLSDIAAMGAEPRWALVSLLISREIGITDLEQVYAGMRALGNRHAVTVVGGNVSSSGGPFCLDITLLGTVDRSHAIRRAGARIGDAILVTGTLGTAAAGVLWSTPGEDRGVPASLSLPAREKTHRAMAAPSPQVAEGRALAASGLVTSMIDVSDGLAADLGHICRQSHVGAVVEAASLPLEASAREVADVYRHDPLQLALYGGEDYVLLCTVAAEKVRAALAAIAAVGGEGFVIGHIVGAALGMQLQLEAGQFIPLEPRGWDHLH
jgi:thiamine-monophosphate kinase